MRASSRSSIAFNSWPVIVSVISTDGPMKGGVSGVEAEYQCIESA
jgi:hypothetical protein